MELIECRGEGVLPVVIHCTADEGDQPRQSHVTVGGMQHTNILDIFQIYGNL